MSHFPDPSTGHQYSLSPGRQRLLRRVSEGCSVWVQGIKFVAGFVPFGLAAGEEVTKVYLKKTTLFECKLHPDCTGTAPSPAVLTLVDEYSRKFNDVKETSITSGVHGIISRYRIEDHQATGQTTSDLPLCGGAPGLPTYPDPTDMFWAPDFSGCFRPSGGSLGGIPQYHQCTAPAGVCGANGARVRTTQGDNVIIDQDYNLDGVLAARTTVTLSSPYTKAEWFADALALMNLFSFTPQEVEFAWGANAYRSWFGCNRPAGSTLPTSYQISLHYSRPRIGAAFGPDAVELTEGGADTNYPAALYIGGGVVARKARMDNLTFPVTCKTLTPQIWTPGGYAFNEAGRTCLAARGSLPTPGSGTPVEFIPTADQVGLQRRSDNLGGCCI